jgi:hypothetical protein
MAYQEWLERDEQLAAAAERRAARLENNGEFREAEPNTLWDEYEGNWVEMMEFRIPPKSTDRRQMELDLVDVA